MAIKFVDRVQETCLIEDLGSIRLQGAIAGYRSFAAALQNGDGCYYGVFDPVTNQWECGLGTFVAPDIVTRDRVDSSSFNDRKVPFGGGDKNVYITIPSILITGLVEGVAGATTEVDSKLSGLITINGQQMYATATELNQLSGAGVVNAEYQRLSGVSANIQAQLDGKVDENNAIITSNLTINANNMGLVLKRNGGKCGQASINFNASQSMFVPATTVTLNSKIFVSIKLQSLNTNGMGSVPVSVTHVTKSVGGGFTVYFSDLFFGEFDWFMVDDIA